MLSVTPLPTLPLAEAAWVFLGARHHRSRSNDSHFSRLAPPKREPAELSCVGGWGGGHVGVSLQGTTSSRQKPWPSCGGRAGRGNRCPAAVTRRKKDRACASRGGHPPGIPGPPAPACGGRIWNLNTKGILGGRKCITKKED